MNILYEQQRHSIDPRNALTNRCFDEGVRLWSYVFSDISLFTKAGLLRTISTAFNLRSVLQSGSSPNLGTLGQISRTCVIIGSVAKVGSFATTLFPNASTKKRKSLLKATTGQTILDTAVTKFKKACDITIIVCDIATAIGSFLDYAEIRNIITTYAAKGSTAIDNQAHKQITHTIAIAKIVYLIADKVFSLSSLFSLKTDFFTVYNEKKRISLPQTTSTPLIVSDVARFASKFICDAAHLKNRS